MRRLGKRLCAALAVLALCTGAMAQKNIDKVMERMEKLKDARVTFVKRRDPETRKIVSMYKTVRVTDADMARQAREAFDRDEPESTNSTLESSSRITYTLVFHKDGMNYTYIMELREKGDVEISLHTRPVKDSKKTQAVIVPTTEKWDEFRDAMASLRTGLSGLKTDLQCGVGSEKVMRLNGEVWMDGQRLSPGTYLKGGRTFVVE